MSSVGSYQNLGSHHRFFMQLSIGFVCITTAILIYHYYIFYNIVPNDSVAGFIFRFLNIYLYGARFTILYRFVFLLWCITVGFKRINDHMRLVRNLIFLGRYKTIWVDFSDVLLMDGKSVEIQFNVASNSHAEAHLLQHLAILHEKLTDGIQVINDCFSIQVI